MAFPWTSRSRFCFPESAKANDVALARQLIAELSDRYGVSLRMASVPALPRGTHLDGLRVESADTPVSGGTSRGTARQG
jgi:hypothetical protein